MHDSNPARRWFLRIAITVVLIAALLGTFSCGGLFGTSKKVQVPPLLTPLVEADSSRLMSEIDRLAALHSIHGKVDIQFEDTSFAESGIAEKYRQADGTVTLQRPGKVYLIVQIPFIAKDIAQMTSDGEHFRVAVLLGDDRYKRFVKGTNNAAYERLAVDDDATQQKKGDKRIVGEKETVSALSNLRPQHLTDALMISPVQKSADISYSQSEFFIEEPDVRPQAKKGSRVTRGYYLLEELSRRDNGESKLLRRFWFDRVSGIRLARLQTFDERGRLVTEVSYWDEKPFGANGEIKLPSRIEITRPHDQYKLSITYQSPASVEINKDFRPEAFVLENRWQLTEVDLDTRQEKKANSNR